MTSSSQPRIVPLTTHPLTLGVQEDEFDSEAGKETEKVDVKTETFEVVLQLNPGEDLGLVLVDSDSGVLAKAVDADGVVAEWNMNNPGRAVARGQLLLKVNGTSVATKEEADEAGLETAGLGGDELELTFAKTPLTDEVDGFCKFCDRQAAPGYATCCFQCKKTCGREHSYSCQQGAAFVPPAAPAGPTTSYIQLQNLIQSYNPFAANSGLCESLVFAFIALVWFCALGLTITGFIMGVILLASASPAFEADDPVPCWASQAGIADTESFMGGSGYYLEQLTLDVNFAFNIARGVPSTTTTTTGSIASGNTFMTTLRSGSRYLELGSNDELKHASASSTTWNISATSAKVHGGSAYLSVQIQTTSNINAANIVRLTYFRDGSRVYAAAPSPLSSHERQVWYLDMSRQCLKEKTYKTGECSVSGFKLRGTSGNSLDHYVGTAVVGNIHMWSDETLWQLSSFPAEWRWVLCSCYTSEYVALLNATYTNQGCVWRRRDVFGSHEPGKNLFEQFEFYHYDQIGAFFGSEHLCYKHPDFATNRKCDLGFGVVWMGSYRAAGLFIVLNVVLCLVLCPCGFYCGVFLSLPPGGQAYDPFGEKMADLLLRSSWSVTIFSSCVFIWSLVVIAIVFFTIMLYARRDDLDSFANEDWTFSSTEGFLLYAPTSFKKYVADKQLPTV